MDDLKKIYKESINFNNLIKIIELMGKNKIPKVVIKINKNNNENIIKNIDIKKLEKYCLNFKIEHKNIKLNKIINLCPSPIPIVVNVKVKFIRPEYNNLKEWNNDNKNIYIGRRGIVFIKNKDGKERYPKENSKWHNPYKVGEKYSRKTSLEKYKEYILDKIKNNPEIYNLKELKGKNLGCWCHPELCHGHVLRDLYKIKYIF